MNRRVPGSMANGQAKRLRVAPLLPILALTACASVLGIEDIQEDPGLANGGTDTTTDAQGGDKNTGGSKGGGSPTMTGGEASNVGGEQAMGGDAPVAGTGTMGGEGNPGGTGNPDDPTVRGTLIDFWGNRLPNVAVQVGDALTTTNDDGEFVVEDTPSSYDVSFAFEFLLNGFPRTHGWVFQGLTRRDPTLQVEQGLEIRYGTAVITPTNTTVAANERISVVVGGKDGNTSFGTVATNGREASAVWESGATTQQTAHALHLQYDTDTELPTGYKAYDSTLVALQETGKTQVQLDMSAETIAAGNLQGTVTSGGGSDRANMFFVRFTTGAALQLGDDDGPNAFSYLVPSIPNSSITIAASEGYDDYFGPYALAHKDGLAATDEPDLKIPTPVTLTTPAANAMNVDATTKFSFTGPASNPGPFVVTFENRDSTTYQWLHVVTAEKQLTIPKVLDGGFVLIPNESHIWNVETHGTFASVDEMAGPDGFLDPFAVEGEPVGPNTADGEWSLSASRSFRTAP